MGLEETYINSVPQYELDRERVFFQMFDEHFFEIHEKADLYNFCMSNDDFLNIADYIILEDQGKQHDQLLGCLIPSFMKELKKQNILDTQGIEYIRGKLMEKLFNHKVINPLQQKVLKLVSLNGKIIADS